MKIALLWSVDDFGLKEFCVFNGIPATESLKMLKKSFGESTLSRTQAFKWHIEKK